MSTSPRRAKLAAALTGVAALVLGLTAAPATAAPKPARADDSFVTRHGADLKLGNQPFRFVGTNNYYLHYKSPLMRDAVLDKAAASGFDVVRTWGWFDIGNEDGSNSVAGIQDGTYIQYWDAKAQRPAYNDGASGLQKLDAVVARAKQDGLKLVIPFTNNWTDFGGMDQYVRWAGLDNHDDFYTDARIRGWYKDYVSHILNRVNTITGVKYKDDPTIMTFELANEPRCVGSGGYPRSSTCTTDTLTGWADEMSTFIKSIDRKHLVSMGDEGFFCIDPSLKDEQYDCSSGVDTVRLASLPNMDVMSYHLYPDSWGKTAQWGTTYIRQHTAAAERINKPVMLGEFGLRDQSIRNAIYQQWTSAVAEGGTDGALYWILSDKQDDGTLYPDYDGFTIYCPSPTCTTLQNFEQRMDSPSNKRFAPVADNDAAAVEFGESASIAVTTNDIAYAPGVLDLASIDLDTATAGVQSTITTSAGTWTVSDGEITFVPTEGWSGRTTASYTIADTKGRRSNVATVTVNGKPSPTAAQTLFSFEDGVQGWAPGNWQTDAGTVATGTGFASDGTQSLTVSSKNAWFGSGQGAPFVLTGRSTLSFEMSPAPASVPVSLQTGDAFTWCQIQGNRTEGNTIEVDLASSTCDLTDVRAINVFVSTGTVSIDAVRVN